MRLEVELTDEDAAEIERMVKSRARVILCGLDNGKPSDFALAKFAEAIEKARKT